MRLETVGGLDGQPAGLSIKSAHRKQPVPGAERRGHPHVHSAGTLYFFPDRPLTCGRGGPRRRLRCRREELLAHLGGACGALAAPGPRPHGPCRVGTRQPCRSCLGRRCGALRASVHRVRRIRDSKRLRLALHIQVDSRRACLMARYLRLGELCSL